MAILKVSYDMTDRRALGYDDMAAQVRSLREMYKLIVEESDLRMSLVGIDIDIAEAMKQLDVYRDSYPLCFITKV